MKFSRTTTPSALHSYATRAVILVEFVLAIAVFSFAALAISRHLVALHNAVNGLRRETHLYVALNSAIAEARVTASQLQPGEERDANDLIIRRTFQPLELRNEKQMLVNGLSLMIIEAFYPGEPPVRAEFYVARP